MKNFFVILFIFVAGSNIFGQQDSAIAPPYKRFPTLPPFKLLRVDSVSILTHTELEKNKGVLVMLFNPACEHCKHDTKEIIKNIEGFKKVQIVMSSTATLSAIKEFSDSFGLENFENIKIGRDFQFMLPSFYMISHLPFHAAYSKKGKLLTTFEGTLNIEELIKLYH